MRAIPGSVYVAMPETRVTCPVCHGEALVFLQDDGKMIRQEASAWAFGLGEPHRACPLCLKRCKVSSELDSAYRLIRGDRDPIEVCAELRATVPDLFQKSLLELIWCALTRFKND